MSDRVRFYFRQPVTQQELNLAFDQFEEALHRVVSDTGIHGIIVGLEPTEHAPVADLSVDLSGPGIAYDKIGQRTFVPTDQVVDCAVDHQGLPTEVSEAGNERWLGVFIRFDTKLFDPRTDGNSQEVFFRRDESFKIVVRQAPEGPVGAASRVPLVDGELLVCDVKRRAGVDQITDDDIDVKRRQRLLSTSAEKVAVDEEFWSKLGGINLQAVLDGLDDDLEEHLEQNGAHRATAIDYASDHPLITGSDVHTALNELVGKLVSFEGATVINAPAVPQSPNGLSADTVAQQLTALLSFINNHLSNSTDAHNAGAISASETGWLEAGSVAAQLSQLIDYLGAQKPEKGSALIGSFLMEGDRLSIPTGTLRSQIQALIEEIEDLDGRYGVPQFTDSSEYAPIQTKTFPGVQPTRIDLKWTADIDAQDKTWNYNWHNDITITLVPIADQQVLHIKNERPDPIIIDIGVI